MSWNFIHNIFSSMLTLGYNSPIENIVNLLIEILLVGASIGIVIGLTKLLRKMSTGV